MLSIVIVSCGDDDSTPTILTSELTLNLTGLEDLGEDYVYEGWAIVAGTPISTGTFSVDASGNLSETNFTITAGVLDVATKFVLSIEPAGETGADALAPSDTKILRGDFSGASASISIMNPAAFGFGFTSAAGKYILATPTTESEIDELQGVWFLDNSSGSAVAGLTNLPGLSDLAGWTYEGWTVVNGTQAYSTRTFNTATGADDNASTSLSKGSDGLGFLDEGFINNLPTDFPDDLSGATFVISIESVPGNSPAPFTLSHGLEKCQMEQNHILSMIWIILLLEHTLLEQ